MSTQTVCFAYNIILLTAVMYAKSLVCVGCEYGRHVCEVEVVQREFLGDYFVPAERLTTPNVLIQTFTHTRRRQRTAARIQTQINPTYQGVLHSPAMTAGIERVCLSLSYYIVYDNNKHRSPSS